MAASGGGRTKFIIPPFRQSQAMDEEYANRTWQTLHNAIQEIHRQNASGLSFEELYRNAYNMVLHKFGDKLYNGLVETITLHLRGVAAEVQSASDGDFLAQLRKMWEKHRLSSIMIRDILMYMDRTYVSAQKKVPVFERGLEVFRDEVVRHPRIKDRLLHTLLDLIQRERCNETIERGLIKAATSMLLELGHDVYQRDFEAPMLAATAEFYKKESNEYISQTSGALVTIIDDKTANPLRPPIRRKPPIKGDGMAAAPCPSWLTAGLVFSVRVHICNPSPRPPVSPHSFRVHAQGRTAVGRGGRAGSPLPRPLLRATP